MKSHSAQFSFAFKTVCIFLLGMCAHLPLSAQSIPLDRTDNYLELPFYSATLTLPSLRHMDWKETGSPGVAQFKAAYAFLTRRSTPHF